MPHKTKNHNQIISKTTAKKQQQQILSYNQEMKVI